jgi:hypothetical protein
MSAVMPPNAKKFLINDLVAGKSIPIRMADDALLKNALPTFQQEHAQLTAQALQLLDKVNRAAEVCAAVAYEIDRRSRTFEIVQNLPRR